ncbi:MAG TPA: family 1 glycosylhydrolase, partial [Acidimicrobiales bacterium]|nr:family 1 glycosylhydrolase [Acidimicrobiales bacterium]
MLHADQVEGQVKPLGYSPMAARIQESSSQASLIPPGFRFGVATAGFQVEGGFNGPGEPANNWLEWERDGRVEPSGAAVQFWDRYEDHLDRVVALGCNSIRMGIEWARCEPEDGVLDRSALDRYATILQACRSRGIEPLVTLHHFTHPSWLGVDFWLDPGAPERYLQWVQSAVTALHPFCSNWVTINELNIYAIETYFAGTFPPGRRGDVRSMIRSMDHLLAAHVGAYELVHRIQPDAVVGTNNFCFSIYDLDRLLIDIITARGQGVSRDDLHLWLEERRYTYHSRVAAITPSPYRKRDALLSKLIQNRISIEKGLTRAVAAAYSSPHECCIDVSQIDYYDPVTTHHLRVPGHQSAGGRNWLPGRMLWDHIPDPQALVS